MKNARNAFPDTAAADKPGDDEGASGIETADSLKAAAAVTGFAEDVLSRAKAAGCPAFRGSRVYIADLKQWMEEFGDTLPTGNSELDAVSLELAREKLRKARFANDVEERRYIKAEDQAANVRQLALELKGILRKKLEEEFPDKQANRTRDEILAINRGLVDELCLAFQEGAKKWSQQETP